jgi:hypothetical protein
MIEELLAFVDVKEGQEDALVDYLKGKMISPEGVKSYLDTQDGKKMLQPMLDRYHNKGLETWKMNNLDSIIEEEVTKRNPGETPEQKRIRALEQKLEQAEAEKRRTRLESLAQSLAAQKGLPSEVIAHFVGSDEDSTEANIETFARVMGESIQQQVKSRFKADGRNITLTKQDAVRQLDKLRDEYQTAVQSGMKLQDRIALKRQIVDLENMKE